MATPEHIIARPPHFIDAKRDLIVDVVQAFGWIGHCILQLCVIVSSNAIQRRLLGHGKGRKAKCVHEKAKKAGSRGLCHRPTHLLTTPSVRDAIIIQKHSIKVCVDALQTNNVAQPEGLLQRHNNHLRFGKGLDHVANAHVA